jgi:hypothetical protein
MDSKGSRYGPAAAFVNTGINFRLHNGHGI